MGVQLVNEGILSPLPRLITCTSILSPNPVCAGDSIDVQVINLGSGDSIPSFTNWTISANGNYNAPSPKDTSLQNISFRGDFIDGIVSVEVTDSNGCFASLVDTVE